jgi:hypothetical protein
MWLYPRVSRTFYRVGVNIKEFVREQGRRKGGGGGILPGPLAQKGGPKATESLRVL